MPLRDYVRGVRDALHRGPEAAPSSSTAPAAGNSKDESVSDGPRWSLRGDLPPDKLFIPDTSLATLASTTFRPQDKMSGVVRTLHGALGTPGGYSVVDVALYVKVQLVETSEQVMVGFPIMTPYDEDNFEKRMIKLTGATLYSHQKEGVREGKEVDLPFQLSIPAEAEGFQIAPSLTNYIQYFLYVSAAEFGAGIWHELYLDDIKVKPRDDALHSIDSLSVSDPFLMVSTHQELDIARQPGWVLAKETFEDVPCSRAPIRWKRHVAEEADGTVAVRLYTPQHDIFTQKPFPLVVKLSAFAPASYGPENTDWTSIRLDIPTEASQELGLLGISKGHEVTTAITMVPPAARGGDGIARERIAIRGSGRFHWENVQPAPEQGEKAHEKAWELKCGFDWSEPQLEPSTSKHAGRWASHAIIKGFVKLTEDAPPSFVSRQGDFRIYNTIDLVFWPQGKYVVAGFTRLTRDLSQPPQEDAILSDGDQLPPYSV